jgi:ATP-dependent Clp protease protease subunit
MSKGLITQFFDYHVDHRYRTIYLGNDSKSQDDDNEVSYAMAEYAIKGLYSLDTTSDRDISIIINTPGGWVSQGMAIYDAIQRCRSHTIGTVFGEAYSMGSVILQACDERILMPHSTMMIHNGSTELGGKTNDVMSSIKFEERLNKICEDIYLKKIKEKKPRFTRKQLQELLKTDTYFTAEEAAKIGLADYTLYPTG